MRKRFASLLLFAIAVSCCMQCQPQSQIDLVSRTRGNLPVARIVPGVAGQCLTTDVSGNTVWATCAAGGGGSGTVTSFSAANLSPLFTSSVATATTTPALSFTLSNFAAHSFFGNNTGASAAPAAVQPKSTDLADFSATAPTSSGKIPIFDQPSGTYIPGDPLVQGLVADSSTTAENPVTIGGYDTAGTPALHRATFINGNPAGTEYGQIVRNIPSGTQTVSVSNFPATQPVSGTVTANIQANASVNLNQVGGTALSAANVVDAANAAFKVNCVTGCTSGGSFTDNTAFTASTTAESNIGGVFNDGLTAVTSGNAAAARITNNRALHTNLRNAAGTEIGTAANPVQISLANTAANATAVKVDNSAVTQPVSGTVTTTPPANASTNVAQVNGVAPLMGNGITGTGSMRVTVASDNTAFSVNSSATQSGTWTVQPGNTANTTAWKVDGSAVTQPVSGTVTDNQGTANTAANGWPVKPTDGTNSALIDPCQSVAKNYKPISLTANTQIITGTAAKQTYFCHIDLLAGAADNVAIIEGTGTTCATGPAGIFGGATAATGWNFAANGGIVAGDGQSAVGATATAADNVCVFVSGAAQLSGMIVWVQR